MDWWCSDDGDNDEYSLRHIHCAQGYHLSSQPLPYPGGFYTVDNTGAKASHCSIMNC